MKVEDFDVRTVNGIKQIERYEGPRVAAITPEGVRFYVDDIEIEPEDADLTEDEIRTIALYHEV